MVGITNARLGPLSIGELARLTGVHIETIRYYERISMLPKAARTEGGRRSYGHEDTRVLAFIRRARDLGFSLNEVRALLHLGAPAQATCAEVRALADVHLRAIRSKLADLVSLEAILTDAVNQCSGETVPRCPVLDILDR
jgi:MerR family transcriptional regulator, mercuric resistance operon regulatory protein